MATVNGTPMDDRLYGTLNEDDTISGGEGNDTLFGGTNNVPSQADTGNDELLGEGGNDEFYGQDGDDTLQGGDGNDQLDGGPGSDSMDGGIGDDRFLLRDTDNTGTDTIIGGAGTDTLFALPNDKTSVVYNAGQGSGSLTLSTGALATFDGIETIFTGGGADTFDGTAAGSAIDLRSGAGNDTVMGSAYADKALSGDGDDSLAMGLGNDTVEAEAGNDSVRGDGGADRLFGNAGNDTVDGGSENDLIVGGDGADSLLGGLGNDQIFGETANSEATGDFNDTISAGSGDDRVWGGGGADRVLGGEGIDTLFGEAGNDSLYGEAGTDDLQGGTGDDYLNGGADNDSIDGGDGNDLAYGGMGNDTIQGGEGSDNLIGDNSAGREDAAQAGDDLIIGGAGGDHVDGNAGNDTVILGSDTLGNGDGTANQGYGGGGSDTIYGESGNDTIYGDGPWATSGGNDRLYGYGGDDIILGDATGSRIVDGAPAWGDDTIDGGDGRDTLGGELGNNLLTGGAGNDVFIAGGGSDTITDFTVSGVDLNNGNQSDNDFVNLGEPGSLYHLPGHRNPDLSLPPGWGTSSGRTIMTGGYYTQDNLEAWNAANDTSYRTPLEWMRADFADDGVLNQPDGLDLTLQGVTDAEQLTFDNTNVACFTRGTLIETDRGEVAVENLSAGDLILTRDNGLQPIRWIGSSRLSGEALPHKLRPIRIRRHALGTNIPARDLLVSPQHRVLVRSKIAQRMFGTDEILVAAKQLCEVDAIDIAQDVETVEYFHMLFDRHEVVLSNGAETESLYTGPEALKGVGPAALEEIFMLFPELADRDYTPSAARKLATGRMARKLAMRHQQNDKPLVSPALL